MAFDSYGSFVERVKCRKVKHDVFYFWQNKRYWQATSGGRFVTFCFLVTDIIVLSDSMFWLNILGFIVGIILIYFLNRP